MDRSVFWKEPTRSVPRTMFTPVGGQRATALTAPADHFRQERQWQNHIAAGLPTMRSSTPPQRQRPTYSCSARIATSWAEEPGVPKIGDAADDQSCVSKSCPAHHA